MFIHWGLYALPARHEWVKNFERITDEDYQKYFDHFDPDLFDPADWARRAREAGMKYVVLTTKHHEGFCLWDTALTDYKSTNTRFGRDIVRESSSTPSAPRGSGSASTTRSSTGTTRTSRSTACTPVGTTARRRSPGSTRAGTWPATASTCTGRSRSC